MKLQTYKTKILQPPKDDLLEVIRSSDFIVHDNDVVVVASKAVAIHEGKCVPMDKVDRQELIEKESDVYIEEPDSRWRITLKHGTFLSSGGIDESNANRHYVLLPEKPHESAQKIREFLMKEYGVKDIGIIIADSHSIPLRYGTVGVALGWSGIEPVAYYTGKPDLFGRPAKFTRINVVDALAVAGVFAMGELAEQTPLCVIRDVLHVTFTDRDTTGELLIPPREDIYWPLLKNLYN